MACQVNKRCNQVGLGISKLFLTSVETKIMEKWLSEEYNFDYGLFNKTQNFSSTRAIPDFQWISGDQPISPQVTGFTSSFIRLFLLELYIYVFAIFKIFLMKFQILRKGV